MQRMDDSAEDTNGAVVFSRVRRFGSSILLHSGKKDMRDSCFGMVGSVSISMCYLLDSGVVLRPDR